MQIKQFAQNINKYYSRNRKQNHTQAGDKNGGSCRR